MSESLRAARSARSTPATKALLFVCSCTVLAALAVSWTAVQATREHLRGDLNARLEDNLTRAAAAVEAWRNERHTARPLDALERAELRALLDRERSTQTRLQLADAGGSIIATSTHPVEPVPIRVPPAALHGDGMGEYAGSDGTRLAVRARALAHGWWLVADEPVALAFAPVTPVSVRIFTVDLALLLLFGLLAHRINAATGRPPKGLHEAVNRVLKERNAELQRAKETFEQLSITDGLTRLHNHRFFQDHLTREIKRTTRIGPPLSRLLIDIDDFKSLNDRFGHAAGDEILSSLARVMSKGVRDTDLLARYGGEEFVVLATDTGVAGSYQLAEKIRTVVAETSFFPDSASAPARVTVSIGVAQYRGNRKGFFQAADDALYRAKDEGKNCCIFVDDEDDLA